MKVMNVNVDINFDIFEESNKTININNAYHVYCKHKCAVKVNVVYVVTNSSMTYDIENFISWEHHFDTCKIKVS